MLEGKKKQKTTENWRKCLPLQRAVPGEGALEEGTAGALREALLVDDAQEDRRRSPWGAGPLLGQLRFLPSAEAVQEYGFQCEA